jgi:glycine/D-amino acid oxidase-like deaminating enzyme/nitrite reductase/ring-hydroxylating ferredoxin subunit
MPDIFDTTPLWSDATTFPHFPPLAANIEVDVAVVGGGITGLTAAYFLARAGKRVAVLERGRCAGGDTGHTTAHLTMVTDGRLRELVKSFGRDHAQASWDAGLSAIAAVDEMIREHAIDARFAWVDGYLHLPVEGDSEDGPESLEADAALARELGFDAEFVENVPFVNRPGVRFADQARFHPRAYLASVARATVAAGGRIHEFSEVTGFHDDPRRVETNGHVVTCEDVVLATHNPIAGLGGLVQATLFQTKLALYSSYVVAGQVPRGAVPDALFWDTANPYQYVRLDPWRDHAVVILGGKDHKTGQQDDTAGCVRQLEQRLKALVSGISVTHRWSGQVIETPDGLPYIGRVADHQYAATGFAGNGMTFGTLAGIMTSDAILGIANPWADLFDPGRKAVTRGLWDYVKENADYPYYMVRGRFAGAETRPLRTIKRGHGEVIERDGRKVAAYRDTSGEITLRSAICTHMGCTVTWNTAERTWDCPCHGSRFTRHGDVISGPAETALPPVE